MPSPRPQQYPNLSPSLPRQLSNPPNQICEAPHPTRRIQTFCSTPLLSTDLPYLQCQTLPPCLVKFSLPLCQVPPAPFGQFFDAPDGATKRRLSRPGQRRAGPCHFSICVPVSTKDFTRQDKTKLVSTCALYTLNETQTTNMNHKV